MLASAVPPTECLQLIRTWAQTRMLAVSVAERVTFLFFCVCRQVGAMQKSSRRRHIVYCPHYSTSMSFPSGIFPSDMGVGCVRSGSPVPTKTNKHFIDLRPCCKQLYQSISERYINKYIYTYFVLVRLQRIVWSGWASEKDTSPMK